MPRQKVLIGIAVLVCSAAMALPDESPESVSPASCGLVPSQAISDTAVGTEFSRKRMEDPSGWGMMVDPSG